MVNIGIPGGTRTLVLRASAIAAAAAIAVLAGSCLSSGAVEGVLTVGDAERSRLDEIESSIVGIRMAARYPGSASAPGSLGAPEISRELAAARKSKVTEKPYIARVHALSGESFLLEGDSASAKTMLKRADEVSGFGQAVGVRDPAPVLRAYLVDASKRLEVLKSSANPLLWGKGPDAVPARINMELALAYAEAKRYADAAKALDAAYPFLNAALREAYAPLRDEIRISNQAGVKEGSALIADANPLTMGLLARALWLAEPSIVEAGAGADDAALLAAFIAAGIVSAKDSGAVALRADAARPLFALYLRRSGEKGIERRYTDKYAPRSGESKGRSPIPDIPYGSANFDAILALVEKEIMDLPDGEYFLPGEALSGLAFLEMLSKIPAAKP
jgi:hypothetical protein